MRIRITYFKDIISVVDHNDTRYYSNSRDAILGLQRLLEKNLTHAEASRFSVVFIMNLIMLPVGTSLVIEIPNKIL